jgi:hypothetical protein
MQERFIRIVGRRVQAPEGRVPPQATRAAMDAMARYTTRAPKGVFVYASHEAANRDRDAWQLDAMIAKRRNA